MYFKLVDIAIIVYEISWLEYGNVNRTALHNLIQTGSDQAIESIYILFERAFNFI